MLLLLLPAFAFLGSMDVGGTTHNTISVDGALGDWHTDEKMGVDASKSFYFTWDADNLYFGWDGTNWALEGDLFIYINTTMDGSYSSVDWSGPHTLPFKGDYVFCMEGSDYFDLRHFSVDSWQTVKDHTGFAANTVYIGWAENPVTEITIPLSDLGNPSSVDLVAFAQWEDANNIWASFPTDNPASGEGSEILSYYYKAPTLGSGTAPNTLEVGFRMGGIEPREDAINLAIVWHQHQPYYKNVLTGKYEMPWVRVHTSQEYLDSPKILLEHPGVKVTFNIVPSLIQQIVDYTDNGVLDRNTAWLDKGVENLTEMEKHTMQFEFFWVPSWQYSMNNEASRYYHYLYNKTMHNLTPETIMMDTLLPMDELFDLAVVYHLFQLSPWYVQGFYEESERDERIMALYDQYGGYTQADLDYILDKQLNMMDEVLDVYAEAQNRGQAELITSPYSHPILPLLMMPGWNNEQGRFIYKESWYDDVVNHLDMAKDIFQEHFGQFPKGMWPSEQSVSQAVIEPIADSGIDWMITDEMVLDASGFDAESNDVLCKPYLVESNGKQLNVIFRDRVISDRIAWQYGKLSAKEAVDDFMDYVWDVRESLSDPADSLLTVALDGENWMFMSFVERDNGRLFMDELYSRLENTDWIRTTGVKDYIAQHPPDPASEKIDVLAKDCPNGAGSWIDGTMSTWSGEEEESLAWERLIAARDAVIKKEQEDPDFEGLDSAWKSIYAAEGSDWFWWYGLDQDSGYDELWDELFKTHLMNVYTALDEPFPPYLKNLWLPPQEPDKDATEVIDPGIDGYVIPGEWDGGYLYVDDDEMRGRSALEPEWDIDQVHVGYSSREVFVRVDMKASDVEYMWKNPDVDLSLYVGAPNARDMNIYSTNYLTKYSGEALNYPCVYRVKLINDEVLSSGRSQYGVYQADGKENWIYKLDKKGDTVAMNDVVEWAIPFKTLGIAAGDEFRLRVVLANATSGEDMDIVPKLPMEITVPRDVSPEVVLYTLEDTEGDETGDGNYAYPLAQDFSPHSGLWDILGAEISATEYDLIFRLQLAEITNVWHLRYGFSHQIIQIYVDQDRKSGSGEIDMLPGANAQVDPDFAWEVVISATGDSMFVQQATGEKVATGCEAVGDADENTIELIVSKEQVGSNVASYGYVLVIGSQDGFGTGKWRDVDPTPSVWTLGGGELPNSADGKEYDPGIMDALLGPDGESSQSSHIGSYNVASKKYARIPGITIPEIEQQVFGEKTKGVTGSGAIVSWQTTKPGTSKVEYGKTEALGSSTDEDMSLETAHSLVLTNLSASTTYYYRAGSRDGNSGPLFWSPIAFFNTTAVVDDEPPMIILPAVEFINDTAVNIHFLTDEVAVGKLEIGDDINNMTDKDWEVDFSKKHAFQVGELEPGATYYYRLSAKDSLMNLNSTDILDFIMGQEDEDPDDDDDDDPDPSGDPGKELIRETDSGVGMAPGTYLSVYLEDLSKGNEVEITGSVTGATIDILVLNSGGFSDYTSVISKSGSYFAYFKDAAELWTLGSFELGLTIPASGDYYVIFDNTDAPVSGARPDENGINATVNYDIRVLEGKGNYTGTPSMDYGAVPSFNISRSLTLEKGTYAYFEMKDYGKGDRISLYLTVKGGNIDILVLESDDYTKYRIESSGDDVKYSFLTQASRLDTDSISYTFVIPVSGSYYLIFDNTDAPDGGARSNGKIELSFDLLVDRSGSAAVIAGNAGDRTEVIMNGDTETSEESSGIIVWLILSVIFIALILILIIVVFVKIKREEDRLGVSRSRGNGGGDMDRKSRGGGGI